MVGGGQEEGKVNNYKTNASILNRSFYNITFSLHKVAFQTLEVTRT